MQRLLLGIMDKAQLKLGDNTVCNFEKCVIFFTSNLGTKGLFRENRFTFSPTAKTEVKNTEMKSAIDGFFATEFRNRLTNIFYYQPLTEVECRAVVAAELEEMGAFWGNPRGGGGFSAEFTEDLHNAMFERGFSREFGGRELKRTIGRDIAVPLARHVRDEWKGRNLGGMRLRLGWNGALTVEVLEDNFLVAAQAATGRKIKR
jgi:ATP-dependent Clp protease ATP-binding subunit ClpA